jgi:hypothetical protein
LLAQARELRLLLGNALRQQLLVGGTGRRRCLVDELAQVGADDRDAIVEFGDRRESGRLRRRRHGRLRGCHRLLGGHRLLGCH